jgi:hypothetical protein
MRRPILLERDDRAAIRLGAGGNRRVRRDGCPPSGTDPTNFDNTFMRWADAHGVGYLGWGWVIPDPPRECLTPYLISDYAGTPVDPNGVALHAHLAALWAAAQVKPNGATGSGAGTTASGAAGGTTTKRSRQITTALAGFLRRASKPPSAKKLLRGDGWKAKFTAPSAGLFLARWELPATKKSTPPGLRMLARGLHRFGSAPGRRPAEADPCRARRACPNAPASGLGSSSPSARWTAVEVLSALVSPRPS